MGAGWDSRSGSGEIVRVASIGLARIGLELEPIVLLNPVAFETAYG